MKTSGFTFIHNAIESGYPIVEAIKAVQPYVDEIVVVDMESTDGTGKLLQRLSTDGYISWPGPIIQIPITIIQGKWGNEAGKTLAAAHALNTECDGDIIVHFEADEVYDDSLMIDIMSAIHQEQIYDIAIYRLQLEQNFQRARWYPEPVHRVFPKGTVIKEGHTTNRHNDAIILSPSCGFLWDITNCFRDNWVARVNKQAELWSEEPQHRRVPLHFTHSILCDPNQFLPDEHWTWKTTPFDIPDILKHLVGKTKYEPIL